ncbi:MAG: hypothetical protein ACJAYU_005281 [Bradymonadia bacterium]|jgi:hypothetical protein
MGTEPPPPALPRSLRQAMALQTMSLLFRRHGKPMNLRLVELHPGGGMYDCLALMAGEFRHTLCMFNLRGSSVLLEASGPPRPPLDANEAWHDDLWRYPREFLAAGGGLGFADRLSDRLGLPGDGHMPQPSPASVSMGVLAELAHRYALSTKAPFFRSGFFDTSGMAPSSTRPWVAQFPKIKARCDAAGPDGQAQARIATCLWGSAPTTLGKNRRSSSTFGRAKSYARGTSKGRCGRATTTGPGSETWLGGSKRCGASRRTGGVLTGPRFGLNVVAAVPRFS